jgi:2-dehydro-3-deoxyphosphogluconate aldolase/(4S)-4-hydroxy-2-oxoglutarate aldolase
MHTDRLDKLRNAGIVAVLRAPSVNAAVNAVDALVAGGVTAVEITYSTPDPAAAIREIVRRHGDSIYVGAGTILQAEQAQAVVDAGAKFLVSPGVDPVVARAMIDTGAVVILGAITPTEIMSAIRVGSHAVKVFPASLGGPRYLASLRGPFPDVPFMPTGGVNEENLGEWLTAGSMAVGAGGELCPAAAMNNNDWALIEKSARRFIDALERLRALPVA